MKILMIGRFKDANLASAAADFTGRIDKFFPCQLKHLRQSRCKDDQKDGSRIIEEETARFLENLAQRDYCVLLDRSGVTMDSLRFARFLDQHLVHAHREMVFLVGGHLGVGGAVRKRADATLALSAMTLTHEMTVVFLAEQLFRGLTIIRGIPYHR